MSKNKGRRRKRTRHRARQEEKKILQLGRKGRKKIKEKRPRETERRGRVAGVGRGEEGDAPQRQTKENHHLCAALQMVTDGGEDCTRQMQATQNMTLITAWSACSELS